MHLSPFAIVGNTVYVADGARGLAIYDVTDPAKPRQVGAYPTDSAASTVRVDGTCAWVSTAGGTLMFDVSNPTLPQPYKPNNGQDGFENNSRDSRLVTVKILHAVSRAQPGEPIAAVVGDRLYISRDDGVVELKLHGMEVSPGPGIASRTVADLTSTQAAQQLSTKVRTDEMSVITQAGAEGVQPRFLTQSSIPHTQEIGLVSGMQPSTLAVSLLPPKLTGVLDAGVLHLFVSGVAGQGVRVQRSGSVADGWEDWQTIVIGESPCDLTDETAAGAEQIFYRAVAP